MVWMVGRTDLLPGIWQVKGVWANTNQAWKGIDEVLPTAGGAWESQDDPTGKWSGLRT